MPAKVVIVMGSKSDLKYMEEAARALRELEIPYQIRVLSAHRTPEAVRALVDQLEPNGYRVVIAGAGGAAHLAGVIAAHTPRPVIGVPLPTLMPDGLDALLSTVQMPPGVPVATVGVAKAYNAGLLAGQMLGLADEKIHARVQKVRAERAEQVLATDAEIQARYDI